jgi:hypothetical protein
MKDRGIGPVVDHTVWAGAIKPPLRVIITKPLGDKNRMVSRKVALRKIPIHLRGSLSDVIVVDPLDAAQAGVFLLGPTHLVVSDG